MEINYKKQNSLITNKKVFIITIIIILLLCSVKSVWY